MRILLRDEHLLAVPPRALSAYIVSKNWTKTGEYGEYSDVYEGDGLPSILVPNTMEIGDYVRVLARLLDIFARVQEAPVERVYTDLVYADRDVIRVRVDESDRGPLLFDSGVALVNGAKDMLLASALSLSASDRRPVLGRRRSSETTSFLESVRMGQTEEGSYIITLLPPPVITVMEPVVGTPIAIGQPDMFDEADIDLGNAPFTRRMTRHLSDTLTEVRRATEGAVGGEPKAFLDAVERGVSANLCEALVQIIGSYEEVDVSIAWAATLPMPAARNTSPFFKKDTPVLEEAARQLRKIGPRPDQQIFGQVVQLTRRDGEINGAVRVRATIDDRLQSVVVELPEEDYNTAIEAHQGMVALGLRGELEKVGQRWYLRDPEDVVHVVVDAGDGPIRQLDLFETIPSITTTDYMAR